MGAYRFRFVSCLGAAVALLVLFASLSARDARADKRTANKIKNKLTEAMEYYDLLEYEEARKHLSQALTMAKKADMENDPVVAQVHLHLGIVYFAGLEDAESAKLSFINAVEIDSSVEIDVSYRTDDMAALLAAAKKEFGGNARPSGGGGDDDDDDGGEDVDCASVTGIVHTLVDSAKAGADKTVVAHVADDLGAEKVALHYRPQGASDFAEVAMSKKAGCTYEGAIPSKAIRGDFLHYYVAAYNGEGKALASKGSAGSPNIIEVIASSGGGDNENPLGMDENPLAGRGGGGGDDDDDDDDDTGGGISGTVPGAKKPAKLFVSVAAGTGAGFVNGNTEQTMNEVGCCFAPALLHLFPELGYYLSPRSSISAAFRAGFVVGANRAGHATFAPAAVMRYRYALDPSGDGLQVSGSVGGGLMRHTVKLAPDSDDGMGDTDTTASGPLLIGGGVGWSKPMGGAIRFVAEVNALAGIPIISELGTCPGQGCIKPNFAVQFDVNLGLLFSF